MFAQIFHAVASKLRKKSPIGRLKENFLGLAVILTVKRDSFSQASDIGLNEACSVLAGSASIQVKKIASIVDQITLMTPNWGNVTQIMTSNL